MARLPFEIEQLLSMSSTYGQIGETINQLIPEIAKKRADTAEGMAIRIAYTWQFRFDDLLGSEIPDWRCLAAFRSITDFNIDPGSLSELSGINIGEPTTVEVSKKLATWDELITAYKEYFGGRDLHSGKFTVVDTLAFDLLSRIAQFRPTVGGQAGNILWLLAFINARAAGYVPYLAQGIKSIPEILDIPFLSITPSRTEWFSLGSVTAGVLSDDSGKRTLAPSGASFVIAQLGKRMILELPGFRVVNAEAASKLPNPFDPSDEFPIAKAATAPSPDVSSIASSTFLPTAGNVLPFKQVEFRLDGLSLGPKLTVRTDEFWPQMPFFARIYIDNEALIIDILGCEALRYVMQSSTGGLMVDQAVMGGLNAVFYDSWLKRPEAAELQLRLANIVEDQMRCLRSCGIRVGAELSSKPDRDYYEMLKRLCGDSTIVALGINGEDELPQLTNFGHTQIDGRDKIEPPVAYDIYLDVQEIPEGIRAGHDNKKASGFPFITYLRAKKLAAALNVRTLYVHTNSLDLILRRGADQGALLHAQRASFLGKGLVIAALMKRSYPVEWQTKLPAIPLAVSPDAMLKLWHFANMFDQYQARGSLESLASNGMWINPAPASYSVALVPVIWPDPTGPQAMPPEFNATGAGDMTFGGFFFMGGL